MEWCLQHGIPVLNRRHAGSCLSSTCNEIGDMAQHRHLNALGGARNAERTNHSTLLGLDADAMLHA